MRIPYYHVDSFTRTIGSGNPAGVCFLEEWLPEADLQRIARENNHSETSFLVPVAGHGRDSWNLRWFTPAIEVDLCGHATLAAAHVIFTEIGIEQPILRFETRSGTLTAQRLGDSYGLDFPARPATRIGEARGLAEGLGRNPDEAYQARDLLAVYPDEKTVREIRPDFGHLASLDCLGVIVTAPGREVDFVSRFFAPRAGIPEDPVTGSAHCTLAPYWAERLGKKELTARQISTRGGDLLCRLSGDRVQIEGTARTYIEGKIRWESGGAHGTNPGGGSR